MNNLDRIVTFENYDQFYNSIIYNKKLTKELGSGYEGKCYLSTLDNKVYKILYFHHYDIIHDINEIITSRDINLDNFILPDILYTIGDRLLCYKTKYVDENLFDFETMIMNPKNIYKINFDKLLKAYYIMLKDIVKLSNANILISDLSHNLMFTGEKLVGIDTCGYTRVSTNPYIRNKASLDKAIIEIFNTWLEDDYFKYKEELMEINDEIDIETYLNLVSKIVSKNRIKRKIYKINKKLLSKN